MRVENTGLVSGADRHYHLGSQELSQTGQEHQVEERGLQGTVLSEWNTLIGRIRPDFNLRNSKDVWLWLP